MLQCYNRGCGLKFNPNDNKDDSCRHHPGEPYFHDAYKGWSCCKKKTVDFTEFLNTKGCAVGKHSNEKPPELEKPEKCAEDNETTSLSPEVRKPIKTELVRPPFDSELTKIDPTIASAVKEAVDALIPKSDREKGKLDKEDGVIAVGTPCRNGGCKFSYSSPESEYTECQYHPGVPIFHEGMKYWSCCNKKTSDFTAFMNQAGCSFGQHKWIADDDEKQKVNCRYDWHQTPSNVIIAVYAKLYHYEKSAIRLNPVRLSVLLVFPDQNDAQFNLDLELRGIIDVNRTTVKMFATKIEITMPKAEPCTWSKLDFPRTEPAPSSFGKTKAVNKQDSGDEGVDSNTDSDVDLDDIEPIKPGGARLTNIS